MKMTQVIRLLRPHQWVKNIFVFAGLIFAHAWASPVTVVHVLLAAMAFCFMSSAVYIYNDIIDKPYDKTHPVKKYRLISSEKITIKTAVVIMNLLFVIALGLSLWVSGMVALILGSYFLLNIAYTHILKHIIILDVFSISLGFILRLLAGTVGVGIAPSQWLMFCGLMITLFLGFTKRRAEKKQMAQDLHLSRTVLKDYTQEFLDKMISITASCSIIGYGLYTMTSEIHGLIYTLPLVIYGIFRYSYKSGEDMAQDLIKDKHLLVTFVLWLGVTIILVR